MCHLSQFSQLSLQSVFSFITFCISVENCKYFSFFASSNEETSGKLKKKRLLKDSEEGKKRDRISLKFKSLLAWPKLTGISQDFFLKD